MVYIPSGFWSRLITRIMINFSRTGLVSDRRALCHDTLYWRRGIYITYQTGKFLVQALDVSHIPFLLNSCLWLFHFCWMTEGEAITGCQSIGLWPPSLAHTTM